MGIHRINRNLVFAIFSAILIFTNSLATAAANFRPAGETESVAQTVGEAPSFHACIDFGPQGYVVYGEVADLPDDTCRIQNLYSLDGVDYEIYHREWDMPGSITSSVTSGSAIQAKQICLHGNDAPLRDYLAGTLDRFYIKLRITEKSGATCETEAVLIERSGEPQPIPDELDLYVVFSSSMRVRGPSGFYGRYQLTVPDTATAEEIAACLPDTLPLQVSIGNGICDIACPVVWKPLAVSGLTAGESVTIENAAEPIAVPAGTLFDTPLGVYRTDEPLPLTKDRFHTDEVQLVLNVVSPGEAPSGGLGIDRGELKMAFDKKPTGATAIRAYTLVEGETAWTEIQGLSLLAAVNAQPSTANSGYAAVLTSEEEPFRSFLSVEAAGGNPVPFFVGFKIEGGVYDGQQLVLAWPGSYELPPNLPAVGSGSSGNEGNAGSDNKNDSTDEGQRPNLPQQPEEDKQPEENGSQTEDGNDQPNIGNGQPVDGSDQTSGGFSQTDDSSDGGSSDQTSDGSGQTGEPSDGGGSDQTSSGLSQDDGDSNQTDEPSDGGGFNQTGDAAQAGDSGSSQYSGGTAQSGDSSSSGQTGDGSGQTGGAAQAGDSGSSQYSGDATDTGDNSHPAGGNSANNSASTPAPETAAGSGQRPLSANFIRTGDAILLPKTFRAANSSALVAAAVAVTGLCGAGIVAAVWGKAAGIRIFGGIVQKIRSALHGIAK